ncbi:hypothetical protein CONPUDRAFT_168934 [Coniophora puteana RWD-64-598 SS2]|uniref:F-box domain-containing protein n=1 Tax=Coniophora puteana (strain RWD-64-598) TaxID=741705 RepID=A0A5M3MCK9_CONPW|nr:uncharacterized protein CONPUDRAFT_168934 [Coniophora puteana RWD-64-598 SS2]EIW76381.1 hypothetical protein CONPUDRAFT_168934 [Coniophora puteana RWD-64-598 SS2]
MELKLDEVKLWLGTGVCDCESRIETPRQAPSHSRAMRPACITAHQHCQSLASSATVDSDSDNNFMGSSEPVIMRDAGIQEAIPPIMLLPAEILLMIFYWASRCQLQVSAVDLMTIQARHGSGSREEEEARNSEYTTATSQQLAFVCSRWRDVLAMRGVFWKSLDITIDGDTFIPSIIKTFFVASRTNEIQVSVAPRDLTSPSLTPAEEHERLAFIMRHMEPHLERLSRLSINTFYRSTIVNISSFFDGAAMPNLSELHLVSQDTDDDAHLKCTALHFPLIQTLHIDAKSFVDLMKAGVTPSEPLGLFGPVDNFSFSITKFRPNNPSSAPGIAEFFGALQLVDNDCVLYLKVLNVTLASEDPSHQRLLLDSLYSLEVYDLEGPDFAAFFDSFEAHSLESAVVARCKAEERVTISGPYLQVIGVDSSCSLLRMVQDWYGVELSIEECQGFDDWFLGSLAFCSEEKLSRLPCPELVYLALIGCTFSASALQRLCEMRLQVWRKNTNKSHNRIRSISVRGGPKLDESLRRWFEINMDTFQWEEKEM